MSGCVFWDTNLFIYWIEQISPWHAEVNRLLKWQESRDFTTVTSTLAMAEVLVHPLMKGEVGMARRYRDLLNHMGCLSFGPDEAWAFAELRAANPSLKPPDAVQLACASVRGVELFVTNDARLRSLRVSGIKRIESLASAVADEG